MSVGATARACPWLLLVWEGEAYMFSHGVVSCTRCWEDDSSVQEAGSFRLIRDPGHWGSGNPRVLVLGMSKGNIQSNAFGREPFEAVAFKGIRDRILLLFKSVGLLRVEDLAAFERRFTAYEEEFAFASVIRCSLTGWNPKKRAFTAESPAVLPAFRPASEGHKFVTNCVQQHIAQLPSKTRLVVLLGNTDGYIKAMSAAVAAARGEADFINPVAYRSSGVKFVHLAHPSRGNGHFDAFLRGEGKPGQKRDYAKQAIGDVFI